MAAVMVSKKLSGLKDLTGLALPILGLPKKILILNNAVIFQINLLSTKYINVTIPPKFCSAILKPSIP